VVEDVDPLVARTGDAATRVKAPAVELIEAAPAPSCEARIEPGRSAATQ